MTVAYSQELIISGIKVGCNLPIYPLYLITGLPTSPDLVSTNTTPFAAFEPKIEAEAASFNTDIFAISDGSILSNDDSIPSISTKGLIPAPLNVPGPRTNKEAPFFAGFPEPCLMETPLTCPTSAKDGFVTDLFSRSLLLIEETDPVKFTFFCVPYPTTTTSSSNWVSDSRTI